MKHVLVFALALVAGSGAMALDTPTLIPVPKSLQCDLTPEPVVLFAHDASTLVVKKHGAVSPLVDRAAEKLAEAIKKLSGSSVPPKTILTGSGAVVLNLGITPALTSASLPSKPAAYVIEVTGKTITVIGADDQGLRIGVLNLAQLLQRDQGGVVLPQLTVADYPDIPYNSMPIRLNATDDYLAFVAEVGHLDAAFSEIFVKDFSTGKIAVADWAAYKALADRCHKYGIKLAANNGYYLEWLNRPFCAVADTPGLVSTFEHAMTDGGADGFSMHFDDIFAMPANVTHWKTCPKCSAKFTSLAQSQAWCLQQLYEMGKKQQATVFWACPTLYSDHGTGNYNGSYGKIDPTLNESTYFKDFCNFPGADQFGFFYAYYGRGVAERLKKDGLKNVIWWNNGPWSGDHPEVFGAYVVFPKMAYSWDMYDWAVIESTYNEKFDRQRYLDLADAAAYTTHVYAGSYDPIGVALSGLFSWNNRAFIADEEAVRSYLFAQLFGKDGVPYARYWEDHAKPLYVKYLKNLPFTDADIATLPKLEAAYQQLCRRKQQPDGVYSASLPHFPVVLKILNGYPNLIKAMPDAGRYKTAYQSYAATDRLFVFAPASAARPPGSRTLEMTLANDAPLLALFHDLPAVSMRNSKLTLPGGTFNLSNRSFSVVLAFTPSKFGNNYFTQLLGVRATYRDQYSGFPGWGIGIEGPAQQVRFVVEDDQKTISVAATPPRQLEAGKRAVVVAVRDFKHKKLLVYVDGKLVNSADEKGSGRWQSPELLQLGYDNMGGGYYIGGIHSISLIDKALSATEVAQISSAMGPDGQPGSGGPPSPERE